MSNKATEWVVRGAFPVGIVIIWALLAHVDLLPDYVLPSPRSVVGAGWQNGNRLMLASLNTLSTAIFGFMIAMAFGIVAGLGLYASRMMRSLALPILVSLKSTPIIAMVPIVTLVLKIGFRSKLLLALTACFFPMVLSTYSGLQRVPPGLWEFASAAGASKWQMFTKVSLPSAANELALGIRVTLPLSFVGAVVAEMAGGDEAGIGYLIIGASYRLNTALLYASVLCLMIISACTFYVVSGLIGRINPAYREGR